MGGLKKLKPEGGSGGKRGHSNMEHWVYTHEVKDAARTRRRLDSKKTIREGVKEYLTAQPATKKTRGKAG